jgi:hypothetical protein
LDCGAGWLGGRRPCECERRDYNARHVEQTSRSWVDGINVTGQKSGVARPLDQEVVLPEEACPDRAAGYAGIEGKEMSKVYGGRWEIINNRRLGGGGQGEVFRVRDANNTLAGEFALKRVTNVKRRERGAGARFTDPQSAATSSSTTNSTPASWCGPGGGSSKTQAPANASHGSARHQNGLPGEPASFASSGMISARPSKHRSDALLRRLIDPDFSALDFLI